MKTFYRDFVPGVVLIAALALILTAAVGRIVSPEEGGSARWYKGNTHTHTILCGHADTRPKLVARWYHDRGYHFLCLSEHNQFIDPAEVSLPEDRRDDFILIPSEEITGSQVVHTTGMNIDGLVDWRYQDPEKRKIVQNHVDLTRRAGGVPILNHPNFRWALSAEDIGSVSRLHLFELFNGHPHVRNFGDAEHPGTEALWDALLTGGMAMYGVSSDDAHIFKERDRELSNPGRGWVMVRAEKLTSAAIAAAMERGDFYATNGVILRDVSMGEEVYAVSVDEEATAAELRSKFVTGRIDEGGGELGILIEFIGPGGKVLQSERAAESRYAVTDRHAYVRCRVTWTRSHENGVEHFHAWTQPVFTDGRLAEHEGLRPEHLVR